MRTLLRKFWTPRLQSRPEVPISTSEPVCIIGDIHGRHDLLINLLHRVDGLGRIVLVGDYIDRGEHSAAVIDLLMDQPDNVCLKGNHEAMCLAFLDDPLRYGDRWMRNGGLQTLASFGVGGIAEGDGLARMRDGLARVMGEERINWLRGLSTHWASGNLVVTHAGADPSRRIDEQEERTLLWGHADFLTKPRSDGLWVAHGHVIVDQPSCSDGRIAVDTGAYATGRLTAAVIKEGQTTFTST
jgi:serine/threonine protein phosphatase 1